MRFKIASAFLLSPVAAGLALGAAFENTPPVSSAARSMRSGLPRGAPRGSHDFASWCKRVRAWRADHDGYIPKRASDDEEERSLAMFIAKAEARRSKALGFSLSQRKLTHDEIFILDQCLSEQDPPRVNINPIGAPRAIPCAAAPYARPTSSPSDPSSEIQLAPMPEAQAAEAHDIVITSRAPRQEESACPATKHMMSANAAPSDVFAGARSDAVLGNWILDEEENTGRKGEDGVSLRAGRCAPTELFSLTASSSSSALGNQPAVFAGPPTSGALDSAATPSRGPAQETSESGQTTTSRAAPATATGTLCAASPLALHDAPQWEGSRVQAWLLEHADDIMNEDPSKHIGSINAMSRDAEASASKENEIIPVSDDGSGENVEIADKVI